MLAKFTPILPHQRTGNSHPHIIDSWKHGGGRKRTFRSSNNNRNSSHRKMTPSTGYSAIHPGMRMNNKVAPQTYNFSAPLFMLQNKRRRGRGRTKRNLGTQMKSNFKEYDPEYPDYSGDYWPTKNIEEETKNNEVETIPEGSQVKHCDSYTTGGEDDIIFKRYHPSRYTEDSSFADKVNETAKMYVEAFGKSRSIPMSRNLRATIDVKMKKLAIVKVQMDTLGMQKLMPKNELSQCRDKIYKKFKHISMKTFTSQIRSLSREDMQSINNPWLLCAPKLAHATANSKDARNYLQPSMSTHNNSVQKKGRNVDGEHGRTTWQHYDDTGTPPVETRCAKKEYTNKNLTPSFAEDALGVVNDGRTIDKGCSTRRANNMPPATSYSAATEAALWSEIADLCS